MGNMLLNNGPSQKKLSSIVYRVWGLGREREREREREKEKVKPKP